MEDNNIIDKAVQTIKCKFVHSKEVYIASNQTLWPCCFLWTHSIKYPEEFYSKIKYEENWNNLKFKSMDEILSNDWFNSDLEKSWDPKHPKHFALCIKTCGFNQIGMNEINFENNNEQ